MQLRGRKMETKTEIEKDDGGGRLVVVALWWLAAFVAVGATEGEEEPPVARAWPPQFHSILMVNYSGNLSLIDLWYDWPNGRNFNIIQDQLGGEPLYDLEWNNGTSFNYQLGSPYCRSFQMEVGILRPNWLDGATYLGQRHVDGFLCNVWQKVDFIWYYEDVVSRRPVNWVFYTGRSIHVMTFEVGAVLQDEKWQAPVYCFGEDGVMSSILDSGEVDQHLYAALPKEELRMLSM